MPGTEGDLFGLSEVVRRVGVQRHHADRLNGGQFLRDQLRRVEQVDPLEHLVFGIGKGLDSQFPLRERARLDRVDQVTAVEVRVDPACYLGLFPRQGVHPCCRFPVEFHQGRIALASTSRKVCTPKPSIVRQERGIPRSDMFHSVWWVASVCNDTKSQNVSCALWAPPGSGSAPGCYCLATTTACCSSTPKIPTSPIITGGNCPAGR